MNNKELRMCVCVCVYVRMQWTFISEWYCIDSFIAVQTVVSRWKWLECFSNDLFYWLYFLFIPNPELIYFGQLESMQNNRCLKETFDSLLEINLRKIKYMYLMKKFQRNNFVSFKTQILFLLIKSTFLFCCHLRCLK